MMGTAVDLQHTHVQQRLRVLIAEDEPASRLRLRRMIHRHPALELVAECACGATSAEAIRRERPALVFLDIQMPALDGFQVVEAVRQQLPAIIFVTAYEQYAVCAFDIHAADYLLKPFDDARFGRAVDRARIHLTARDAGTSRARPALAFGQTSIADSSSRIAIRDGDTMRFLEIASMTHVTAEDCYSRVHTTARSYLVREALGRLADRLPGAWFRRIHRSTIVNIAHIELIAPLSHGDLRISVAGGQERRVSRRYRDGIATLFSATRA
jgi:two-component system LytT family response regulator